MSDRDDSRTAKELKAHKKKIDKIWISIQSLNVSVMTIDSILIELGVSLEQFQNAHKKAAAHVLGKVEKELQRDQDEAVRAMYSRATLKKSHLN